MPAFGLALRWRSDRSTESAEQYIQLHWPQLGPNLELMIPGAVVLAVASYKRVCGKRTSRWLSMMPTLDKRSQWLVEKIESWAEPPDPQRDTRLGEELARLEEGLAGETGRTLLGDVQVAFREVSQLPERGQQATVRLTQLEDQCDEELRKWITDLVGSETLLLSAIPFQVLREAIPAALGQMIQHNNALRSYDPRGGDQWYEQSERLLGRLAFQLEQFEGAAPKANSESSAQLEELAWHVDWASGLIGLLEALPELGGEAAQFEPLAKRGKDLHDRLRVLRKMVASSTNSGPVTERHKAIQLDEPELPSQSRWRRIGHRLWEAATVFSDKGGFSMSASLALSGVFVLLAGLGLLGILMQGISGGEDLNKLLFHTLFPTNFKDLVSTTQTLIGGLNDARTELYVVLTVLFLYFAFMLMFSLTSNLNYLFGISSTHSILDLSFLFGIFWKGFLLRLSSVGVVVAIALGGFMMLQRRAEEVLWLQHPVVNGMFAVLVAAIMLVIVLPLDDVPLREKLIACFGIACFLPLGNEGFDYMSQNFQSYKLLMEGAMVALITLWIYFLSVVGLFALCLLYSLRDMRHVKHIPTRAAVYLEVLRLATTEPNFDELQKSIGAPRSQLHEVINDLVQRKILQRFSPGIKPTAYTGAYHYRILGKLDAEQVRDALFPDIESALGSDVPVNFRTQVSEIRQSLRQVVGELTEIKPTAKPATGRVTQARVKN